MTGSFEDFAELFLEDSGMWPYNIVSTYWSKYLYIKKLIKKIIFNLSTDKSILESRFTILGNKRPRKCIIFNLWGNEKGK